MPWIISFLWNYSYLKNNRYLSRITAPPHSPHTHTQHLKQAWDIMPPPSKSPIPHRPPSLLEGLVVCLGLVCLGNHKGNTVSRIRFWSDVLFFKVLLWHIAITKTYRNGKIYLTYTALCHSYYRDRRGAVILDYYWITLY